MPRGNGVSSHSEEYKNPFENVDVPIERLGKKIILPNDPAAMDYDDAIEVLNRKRDEEEAAVQVMEVVDAFPWDGAVAFMRAMKETYGWAQAVAKKNWWGDEPPTFITVRTGWKRYDELQVIWGSFKIPGIDGELQTNVMPVNNRMVFAITGTVKRKHHREIQQLARLTRDIIRTRSMYRGKAFRMFIGKNGNIDFDRQPEFIPAELAREDELIFSQSVQDQIDTNIFAPIKKTQLCRKHQVPLARGILLEGPFGVGKTLTANVTAKICEEHNWTFIMIDRVSAIDQVLEFAKLYSPAVIFAEDIDRVLSGERDASMDKILNTIDGVQSKAEEVITILTTNEVQKINQAMLRPGRLDAVISITPPDTEAAQRLTRVYARGLIPDGEKLEKSGKALEGQIPAVIREVVERSKLAAISRIKGDETTFSLTDHDLYVAAEGMKQHLQLLNRPRERVLTPDEQLGLAFKTVVENYGRDRETENAFKIIVSELEDKLEMLNKIIKKRAM